MKQVRFSFSMMILALAAASLLAIGIAGVSSSGATAATTGPLRMFNPDTIYGVTVANVLVGFDSAFPNFAAAIGPITGLQKGEQILGIDFRPFNGQLYGLGSTSRLYTIDRFTAAATEVGVGPFSPALSGTSFGFDFNPTVDQIRVVSDADQNLRLNPTTLAVVTDTNLAFAMSDSNFGDNPNVVGAAYTNNFNGATTTTLYDIDSEQDILVQQGSLIISPNTGMLVTIGSLGFSTSEQVGFDIGGDGTAFASLTGLKGSFLNTINLATGTATLIGIIGDGTVIRDIAVFLPCQTTCPANITVANDPNQCGSVVNYPLPTVGGECVQGVGCSPAPGSFFSVGTTTVACLASGSVCFFTVTVIDTQPPTITCPTNVTAVVAPTCPVPTAVVNFPPPTASDNCPGVTVVCNPPSGSPLPVGTTTVTCTATDASGNMATCSFTVTVFSGCLQDETNPGNVVLFDLTTGAYQFCCNGTVFTGTGIVTQKGCDFSLQHNGVVQRVLINGSFVYKKGTAALQSPPGAIRCTIVDKNTTNNTCICALL